MSESFEEFVAARSPSLLRCAWLLTGDREDAEDLVQGTLVKCWPHFDRIRGQDGSFEAYVRRSLLNARLSVLRRRRPREEPRSDVPERTDQTADPDLQRDIVRSMQQLPPRQRMVIVLRYFEDQTEVQTAQLMGCSVGAVKSHHARAIRALRSSPLLRDVTHEGIAT